MTFEQSEKITDEGSEVKDLEPVQEFAPLPDKEVISCTPENEAREIDEVREKIKNLSEAPDHLSDEKRSNKNQENEIRDALKELKKIENVLSPIVLNLEHANNRQGLSKILTWIDFPLIYKWKQDRKKLIKSREPHLQILKGEVEQFALDAKKFFKAIEDSDFFDFYGRLTQNLVRIEELEAAVPGSTKKLSEEYGIFCFARYPKEMLLRQLEQENDTQTPYGVVLHSRTDWNGSFYGQRALGSLNRQTKSVGLNVRIFECGSLFEVSKQLIKLNRKYGKSQKIQFALVAGHGNEKVIELGNNRLHGGQLPEDGLREIAEFFVANPTIVMNSCLTAKEDIGISALLAEVTGAEVIASEEKISDVTIQNIQKAGHSYKFEVSFRSNRISGEYKTIPSRVFNIQNDK